MGKKCCAFAKGRGETGARGRQSEVMKTSLWVLTLLAGASLTVASAQLRRNQVSKDFMREKLALSQQVLEGLALEDFSLIVTKATKLSAMSRQADWRAYENPEYEQQSQIFRRHVETLAKAAREKDLDAATLAYVRMTMSCVDCHKFVRGKLSAQLNLQAQPITL